MTVKYRNKRYKLPMKYIIIVEYYKLLLRLKRIKRMAKRIFFDNKQIYLLPLLILILILITILFGIKYNIYSDFWLGLWDFRDAILVSFVGTLLFNFYIYESNWKNKLLQQFNLYYELLCESEGFIGDLLYTQKYIINSNVFLDRTIMENVKFKKAKKEYFLYTDLENKNAIISRCNNFIFLLEQYRREFSKQNMIAFDNNLYIYYKNEVVGLIKSYKKSNITLLELVKLLIPNLYELINLTRWPWRWDYNIDKKIRKILRNYKIGDVNKEVFDPLEYYDGEEYYDIE